MHTAQTIEDRLWNYIDGTDSPPEHAETVRMLESDPRWQELYKELLEVHALLNRTALDAPSMRFTRNVMEEIAHYPIAPATKTYVNRNFIRGILLVFFLLILGTLLFVFSQLHWASSSGENLSSGFYSQLAGWAKMFNGNTLVIFLLFNTVIGMMLLDKWLERTRHKHLKL